MDEQRFVVRLHDPRRLRLVAGAVVVLSLLLGMGLFELGQRTGGYSSIAAGRERAQLRAEIERLTAEHQALKDEFARLQTTFEVDREAYQGLRARLAEREAAVAELNEEVAFYRRIVTPAEGQPGLRVEAFEVAANGDDNRYRLKLLLVQSRQQAGKTQGRMDLSLTGMLDGKETRLSLQELDSAPQDFEFRYFQDLDLEVVLPPGFQPDSAEVALRPSGRNAAVVAASFAWKPKG